MRKCEERGGRIEKRGRNEAVHLHALLFVVFVLLLIVFLSLNL